MCGGSSINSAYIKFCLFYILTQAGPAFVISALNLKCVKLKKLEFLFPLMRGNIKYKKHNFAARSNYLS